jgi:hypothetical protein
MPTIKHMRIFMSFHHICLRTRLAPLLKPCAETARLSVLSCSESRRAPRSETLLMLSRMMPTVLSISWSLCQRLPTDVMLRVQSVCMSSVGAQSAAEASRPSRFDTRVRRTFLRRRRAGVVLLQPRNQPASLPQLHVCSPSALYNAAKNAGMPLCISGGMRWERTAWRAAVRMLPFWPPAACWPPAPPEGMYGS